MTDASPTGPAVSDNEDLFRCLTHPKWWIEEENRVSSAAFNYPVFSVDIASIAGSEEAILSRFLSGTGLVVFNCGDSRQIGCDPRHEKDDQYPDNQAHAHVYMPLGNNARKRAAQHLVKICQVRRKPQFPTID